MVLCFVVDVSLLSVTALISVKNCLLQLANLYALHSSKVTRSNLRHDAIGLCYASICESSGQYQLTILERPGGTFDLRKFHQATRNLPLPSRENLSWTRATNFNYSGQVSSLSTLLQEEKDGLLSLAAGNVGKKIVLITSHFLESRASFAKSLMDAASLFIIIEFVELETPQDDGASPSLMANGIDHLELNAQQEFAEQISEFENCILRRISVDPWILMRVVKEWHQDLVFHGDRPVDVVLSFPTTLTAAKHKVFCSLQPAILDISDVFKPCKVCGCHGQPLGTPMGPLSTSQMGYCPVTGQKVDAQNLRNNSIAVGSCTILTLPSFKEPSIHDGTEISQDKRVVFNVVRCIFLQTLCEGLLFGIPFIMFPSSISDEGIAVALDDDVDENEQLFASLLDNLHSTDKGLLCTSTVDIESSKETAFSCFYILLPAKNGTFLARRIAGAEEIAILPESATCLTSNQVPNPVSNEVCRALEKLGTESYNPLQHLRGCHSKLNGLVKESLHLSRLDLAKPTTDRIPVAQCDRSSKAEDGLGKQPEDMSDSLADILNKPINKLVDRSDRSLDETGLEQLSVCLPTCTPMPSPISLKNIKYSELPHGKDNTQSALATSNSNPENHTGVSFGKNLCRMAKLARAKPPRQGLCYPPLPKASASALGDPYAFPVSGNPGIKAPLPLLPSSKYPNFKTASQILQDGSQRIVNTHCQFTS